MILGTFASFLHGNVKREVGSSDDNVLRTVVACSCKMSGDLPGLSAEDGLNVREISVPVPWGLIFAKCWGDPSSEPVLVVHGIQDNAGSFDRLLPLLPRCFYYVCMELPGHGKSTRIPKGIDLSLSIYLNSIYRFVKHLKWSQFNYLGHSLGGQIGIYYSAMYPEQVKKLITLDTLPLFAVKEDDYLDHYKNMTEKLITLEEKISKDSSPSYSYEDAVQRLMKKRPAPITRDAAEALVKRMLKQGERGYYFSMDQRLKFGIRLPMTLQQNIVNISKLKCPHLCILTEIYRDLCESEDSDGLAKPIFKTFQNMRNVQMVYVKGYHDVHNNEPETVAPFISKFLVHTKSAL